MGLIGDGATTYRQQLRETRDQKLVALFESYDLASSKLNDLV
ncbi:hypothetical protein [Ensifer adhaerens]|nr:hypothetical protein [Ensifer adhaerens]